MEDVFIGLFFFMPACLLFAGYSLGRLRTWFEPPPMYDEEDMALINTIIDRNMPGELKDRYLYDPDEWWFVEWSNSKRRHRAIGLDLSGVGMKKELDVSGLTGLIWLDCQNNELTSLKLSRLPHLATLNCRDNQLVSLDLSGLPRLTHLDCKNNRQVSVTLPRHWFSLTCIYPSVDGPPVIVSPRWLKLRTFYCQNNPIAIIAPPWRSRLTHLIPPKQPEERRKRRHARKKTSR